MRWSDFNELKYIAYNIIKIIQIFDISADNFLTNKRSSSSGFAEKAEKEIWNKNLKMNFFKKTSKKKWISFKQTNKKNYF